jgi:alanine racemase
LISSIEERPGRNAWLEIDTGALRRNAHRFQGIVEPARTLPMIKADGYGLGALTVADALRPAGPYAFGVATVGEGTALRMGGVTERIVVFSPSRADDVATLIRHRLEPAMLSLASMQHFGEESREAGACLPVHLEIDTGMGRAGLPWGEAARWSEGVASVLEEGGLTLESTFSHFHSADTDVAATRAQLSRFEGTIGALRARGVDPGLLHIANSAAALADPSYHLNLVRPGLYLFGGGRGLVGGDEPPPEPVIRVRARVLEVRELPAGTTVSYGATFMTERASRLATLGIGYADGLPHGASNRASALLEGRRVPIRGAVCMDLTVVDVTGVDEVQPGSVATLLGREGDEEITLHELAEAGGAIEYEVLTGLGAGLPRVMVDSGRMETESLTHVE